MTKEVKPSARGTLDDAAEKWLRDNDPVYIQSKQGWIAPTTDGLSRARSDFNEIHPTLEDIAEMSPKGSGHYHRHASIDDLEAPSDDEQFE